MTTCNRILAGWVVLLAVLGSASCQKSAGHSAKAAASDAKVARVVFIDKQDACDCTRKRADDSWDSLSQALGKGTTIPVERIYIDTEKERAAPYLEMQKLMVIPGIYFLDESDNLVAMLQGEQTADKLAAKLGK
jgi:hypothetical protein